MDNAVSHPFSTKFSCNPICATVPADCACVGLPFLRNLEGDWSIDKLLKKSTKVQKNLNTVLLVHNAHFDS